MGIEVFLSKNIRDAEAKWISTSKISDYELMEQACDKINERFQKKFDDKKRPVHVFCGKGNNGGDGLGLARRLALSGYQVQAYVVAKREATQNFLTQKQRYETETEQKVRTLQSTKILSDLSGSIVVDALLGSGLNKPLSGLLATLVEHLNRCTASRVSIDMPTGLHDQMPFPKAPFVKAQHLFIIQALRPSLLYASVAQHLGTWELIDLNLPLPHPSSATLPIVQEKKDFACLLSTPRPRFMHKGQAGRVGLIAGKRGMLGAAMLATEACLRSGAGMVFLQVPREVQDSVHAALPEVIVVHDQHNSLFSLCELPLKKIDHIGIGPGIGTAFPTVCGLKDLLNKTEKPMVIDADALNILSEYPELFALLPKNSILTPHEGEFRRWVGNWTNDKEKYELLRKQAAQYQIVVVLKGAFTHIACPDGRVFINTSGHPGMATAGAGDVLTGTILSLLGQGIPSEWAARYGVFLHSTAGERAAQRYGIGLRTRPRARTRTTSPLIPLWP